jgi:hypothetical protein
MDVPPQLRSNAFDIRDVFCASKHDYLALFAIIFYYFSLYVFFSMSLFLFLFVIHLDGLSKTQSRTKKWRESIMKKRIATLFLALLLMLSISGNTLALTADPVDDGTVSIMSAVTISCGLTLVSGSSYRPWATATTGTSDTITASFKLYRVVGSTLTLVTSGSNSTTGTSVTASKTVTLSAGSYRIVATGTSSTATATQTKNYTVS